MIICIDFDGTCVTHEFPEVGKDIGAERVLQKLVENGDRLVLFTMRSNRTKLNNIIDDTILDVTGMFLDDAVNWFRKKNLPLFGINENPNQKEWTTSPKAYGQLYIDDASLGCPLIYDRSVSDRPYVDWIKVEEMLIEIGVL